MQQPKDIDRERLAALLGMIGSNADGEALNAARIADRYIRSKKATWSSVLVDCYASGFEHGREAGYLAGLADGRNECIERVAIAEDDVPHTVKARRCLDDLEGFTARERDFLHNVMMQWRRPVSPKQSGWLDSLYARWRADPSRHYRPERPTWRDRP